MQQYADTLTFLFMAFFTALTLAGLIGFGAYWYVVARQKSKDLRELRTEHDKLRASAAFLPDYPTKRRLSIAGDVYSIINDRFNQEEINTLIFELSLENDDLDPDQFPQSTKGTLLMAFWGYVLSRNMTEDVKLWIRENRPDIEI